MSLTNTLICLDQKRMYAYAFQPEINISIIKRFESRKKKCEERHISSQNERKKKGKKKKTKRVPSNQLQYHKRIVYHNDVYFLIIIQNCQQLFAFLISSKLLFGERPEKYVAKMTPSSFCLQSTFFSFYQICQRHISFFCMYVYVCVCDKVGQ